VSRLSRPEAIRLDVTAEALDFDIRYRDLNDDQAADLYRDDEQLAAYCLDAVEFVIDGPHHIDARDPGLTPEQLLDAREG
jgi:hypothetical protein